PHVFAPDGRHLSAREQSRHTASTPESVREQWARIKSAEQTGSGSTPRLLAGVPRALPALLRASKIGARVSSVGFDWNTAGEVMAKIDEEVRELREALAQSPERVVDEMGDVLFSMANLARKLGVDPEAALSTANDRFTRR